MLRARFVAFEQGRDVETLSLGPATSSPATFCARRVFGLHDQLASPRLEDGDVLQRQIGVHPTASQSGTDAAPGCHARMRDDHVARAPLYMHDYPRLWSDPRHRHERSQGGLPRRPAGTRLFLPAPRRSPRNAAARRQADRPIRRRRSGHVGVGDTCSSPGAADAIEDHFDVSVELEAFLEARGKHEQLEEIRQESRSDQFCRMVHQGEPLALGHAVLVTRDLVGDEPFAVILSDDVIDATPPATQQLIDVFDRVGGPVLAVERVPMEDVSNYGVIAPDLSVSLGEGVYLVRDLVEKPPRSEAPSDLAIIGRYILTPDIFPALAATRETGPARFS